MPKSVHLRRRGEVRGPLDRAPRGAHARGTAAYAAKAGVLASPERRGGEDREIRWEFDRLACDAGAALQQLPRLGEDSAGPLGRGLLASGILGANIRTIQASLRGK